MYSEADDTMNKILDVPGYDGIHLRVQKKERFWDVWTRGTNVESWELRPKPCSALEVFKIAESLDIDIGDSSAEGFSSLEQAGLPSIEKLYWDVALKSLPGVQVSAGPVWGSVSSWEIICSIKEVKPGTFTLYMIGEPPDGYFLDSILQLNLQELASASSPQALMEEAGEYGLDEAEVAAIFARTN